MSSMTVVMETGKLIISSFGMMCHIRFWIITGVKFEIKEVWLALGIS